MSDRCIPNSGCYPPVLYIDNQLGVHGRMFTGNCLCNQVRFRFESKPTNVSICHCSICRLTTGSAFGVYIKVLGADLKLTDGAEQLCSYNVTDKLGTQFCRVCGSTVFAKHADFPGFVYVSLGAMAEGSDIRPTHHEFVGSRASWFDIQDSLPKFGERSGA